MYDATPNLETRTKIVATLGPATWNEPMLTQLLESGVDVVRINCSHADHDGIRAQVSRVRRATMRLGRPVALLIDLQGPKIRTGKCPTPLQLKSGDTLTVVMDRDFVAEGHRTGTTYPEMAEDVTVGEPVLFADGALLGTVAAIRQDLQPAEVDITIHNSGELGSHKGINLPATNMSVPCLTEKDLGDLQIATDVGCDYIALSFVQAAADVHELRSELLARGADIPIIAKIEKPNAVDRIDEILEASAGVMVARGDLGVEVDLEKVPVYQKRIIAAARSHGKLCITATQMLDSMERNPRPTRAETTDVANAILDGTDAVMLSGETAVGRYPTEAVRMMDAIAREVEASVFFRSTRLEKLPRLPGPAGMIVKSACYAASENARPLVVFTWSGRTALWVSKARPMSPIFAMTPQPQVADQLAMAWGVTPVVVPMVQTTDDMVRVGERALLDLGLIKRGDEIVILAGKAPREGTTNVLKIHLVGSDD
jgi:pyruvate kinase